jgi:class 3 adenylate cyclase
MRVRGGLCRGRRPVSSLLLQRRVARDDPGKSGRATSRPLEPWSRLLEHILCPLHSESGSTRLGEMAALPRPKTRYITVGDSEVAYQVFGDGPLDLAFFTGIGSHLEFIWDWAGPFLRQLATFSRLILFDRRGTGASDPVTLNAIPTWEEAAEDVLAVLNAVGSERAAIYAEADAGPIAVLFAATHPDRVSALVLGNTSARYVVADDYPIGLSVDAGMAILDTFAAEWGTADLVRLVAPDLAQDEELVELLARQWRSALTPRAAGALWRTLWDVDVRDALSSLQAPTLILHATESEIVPFSHAQYLADHIADAQLVARPGRATGFIPASYPATAEHIAAFLTGSASPVAIDRVLTTILFSDIVASTPQLADVGDDAWRRVLDGHDRVVREQIRVYRGREVNTTGDGFVISFDGPARAIRCAQAITEAVATLGLEVRIGLHCGECEVRGDDLAGLAVHIAARLGALAGPGEVLVSGTVKDLVAGSGIEFEDHGEQELKGVPGSWKVYAVRG